MKAAVLHILRSLHNDESGQDLIEYALLAALVALAATATMQSVGTAINTICTNIVTSLSAA